MPPVRGRGCDGLLDLGPASREFLLGPAVVRRDPTKQLLLRPIRSDAADVVLVARRPTVRPLVVPEVEVPPSIEVADPRAASDLLRLYL